MSCRKYLLQGHKVICVEGNLLAWAEWYENADRRVAQDILRDGTDEIRISTVFLGVDHNFNDDDHVPMLFETMVFGGHLDETINIYPTWIDAEEGHKQMVERVKELITERAGQ